MKQRHDDFCSCRGFRNHQIHIPEHLIADMMIDIHQSRSRLPLLRRAGRIQSEPVQLRDEIGPQPCEARDVVYQNDVRESIWKSAREFNALYTGQPRIRLRQRLGLVFQNPDNQIVGTIVEDDVAFGPENLGLETSQIRQRVDQALDRVHLTSRRYQSPANLSGGQRQRLAIASLLALEPAHLLLDEALSMLDPRGREEVEALLDDLHVGHGITIVHATHNLEELARADRILALEAGRVVFDGPAGDFFEDRDLMDRLHLELSPAMEIAHPLLKRGLLGRPDRFDLEGLLEAITR